MTIEIIPAGSSAVVTDEKRHSHVYDNSPTVICAIKDAEAGLERSSGLHYGNILGTVKDAQADLERSSGLHFGETMEAIKDVEADLERSGGLHYGDTVKTLKDVEAELERSGSLHYADTVKTIKSAQADLERSGGLHYGNILGTVKDAESNIERFTGNQFAKNLENIKDVEVRVEKANAWTRDAVRDAELNAEKAKAKILEAIKDVKCENEKTECKTQELVREQFKDLIVENYECFDDVKDKMQNARKELLLNQVTGFKDNLIEFKVAQSLAYQLAAAADKTACNNQMQILLQFKDQALLTEKLAAQAAKETAEYCCEIKELIRTDGQMTRDLLNRQEQDRLRERALRAEQQLSAYFARGIAPLVPAGAGC